MNWSDFFTYDQGNLIWKVNLGRKIRAGAIAGTATPRGYITVTLNGKKYRAHRVIWEMHNGPIPQGLEIDHEDGVRSNNVIGNLSLKTNAGNHLNMARRADNTSGATGVVFCKATQKWKAGYKLDGKQVHLGYFQDFNDAVAARQNHNPTVGFSSRHGT